MINEDKISVIVPVYNVEKYIHKCVDSIINQDYKNLEIILVDDGSPDNCPAICDEYAKIDHRIKVIHKNNGGLSDARNAGIDMATGEYVVFIDSDDYVDYNHISSLYKLKSKYNADIVCTSYIYDFGIQSSAINKNIIEDKLNEKEILPFILRANKKIGVSADSKLFLKKIIYKHKFIKGAICEDILNSIDLYKEFKSLAYSTIQTYHYCVNSNSIMHSCLNVKNFDVVYVYLLKYYYSLPNLCDKQAIINKLFRTAKDYIKCFYFNKDFNGIKYIKSKLTNYTKVYMFDQENSLALKFQYLLITYFGFGVHLYMFLFKIKKNLR